MRAAGCMSFKSDYPRHRIEQWIVSSGGSYASLICFFVLSGVLSGLAGLVVVHSLLQAC
jgi:hypothetical protein